MSKLINKLHDMYFDKGYINKELVTEETIIDPSFKRLASKVYKNGISEIEKETTILNNISKIIHPSDIRNIVPSEYGDITWIETQWMIAKQKLNDSFPIFVLTSLMLSIIYYLISMTPERNPASETIRRLSKNANKLNSKNKKAVIEAINSFKNFYKGK